MSTDVIQDLKVIGQQMNGSLDAWITKQEAFLGVNKGNPQRKDVMDYQNALVEFKSKLIEAAATTPDAGLVNAVIHDTVREMRGKAAAMLKFANDDHKLSVSTHGLVGYREDYSRENERLATKVTQDALQLDIDGKNIDKIQAKQTATAKSQPGVVSIGVENLGDIPPQRSIGKDVSGSAIGRK